MGYLLTHLLARSAEEAPEAEALRFEGRSLSYGRLEALTNQLARSLVRSGVAPGDRVGLLQPKSPASVISAFAAMRAGAVYVPLDRAAPRERLAYIVRDCGIRAVLTASSNLAEASAIARGSQVTALFATDDGEAAPREGDDVRFVAWQETLAESEAPLDDRGTTDTDLAVVLYTSGSTGAPKGVMLSHRAVLTFVDWSVEEFGLTREDRITSHAPLHFDLSTFDIYATVKAGGTVVLVKDGSTALPQRLADLLQDERITVTYLVPSALTLLALYGGLESHDLTGLRTVLFAGEVFPIKHLRRLLTLLPRPRYYNLYGPTETNVCTFYEVGPADVAEGQTRPLPIGRSCPNTATFALTEDGSPVTRPGQEGELWVRGSTLARGYWGNRLATEAAFTQNPLQPHFKETAYRTGDIVTLAEDGLNWLYRGRRDSMVKVRGYRVELGEIEAVLYRHPSVSAAVAVAVPDELVGNRIVAYAVPVSPGAVSEAELRRHCGSALPSYMLPEKIELRSSLPSTSSGKVDRASLARGGAGSARPHDVTEAGDERRD